MQPTEQQAFAEELQNTGKTVSETSGTMDDAPAKPTQPPSVRRQQLDPYGSMMPSMRDVLGREAPPPPEEAQKPQQLDPYGSMMPSLFEVTGSSQLPKTPEPPRAETAENLDRWDFDAEIITNSVLSCLDGQNISEAQACVANELNVPVSSVQRNWADLKRYRDSEAEKGSFSTRSFIRNFPYEAKLIAEKPEMTRIVVNKAGFIDVVKNGPRFIKGAAKIAWDLGLGQLYSNLTDNTPFTVENLEKAVEEHHDFIEAKEAIFGKEEIEVPAGSEEDKGFFGNIGRDWDAGWLDNEDADLGERMIAAINRGDKAEQAHLMYLHKQNRRQREALTRKNTGALGGITRDVVQSIPGTLSVVKQSGIVGGIGAVVGAGIGGFSTGGAGAIAGAKIGAEIGAGVGVFGGSYAQQSGSEIWEMLELESDSGKKLQPWQAVAAARESAVKGATLETAGDIIDIATLGGAKGLRMAFSANKKVADLLAKHEAKIIAKAGEASAARVIARGAASEALTEGAQQIAQIDQRLEEKEMLDGQPQMVAWDKEIEEIFRSALIGGISGGMFSSVTAASAKTLDATGKVVARRLKEQNAAKDAAKLMSIAKQFADADPTTRGQLAENLLEGATSADGTPIRSLDIDARELVKFFESDGKNWAEEVARVSGTRAAAQIKAAVDGGRPLNISLEDFAVDFSAYKNKEGKTLASVMAGHASVNENMSAADVEAAHARELRVSEAIEAAVQGAISEEQEADLKKYAAENTGSADIVAQTEELASKGKARLVDEAAKAAPHLSREAIDAAIGSQISVLMHHAIETGDIGPLEILTTKTTIDAAQVERLEALAVHQGLSEPKTTQKAEAVPPPVPQGQPSVQEEARAQETTVAEEVEDAAIEETQQAQAEIQKTEDGQVTEEQQAQIEEAQAAIEQAEEDLSALDDLYDKAVSAEAVNEDVEAQQEAPAETPKEDVVVSKTENVDKKEISDNVLKEDSDKSKGIDNETEKPGQSDSEDDIRRILESNRKGYKGLSPGRGATPGDEWRSADTSKISELSARLLREEYVADRNSRRLDLIVDNDGNEYLVNAPNFTYKNLQKLFERVDAETKQKLSDSHTLEEFKSAKFTITAADGLSTLTVLKNGDIVNLININENIHGFAKKALKLAIAHGGIKMDNYNIPLSKENTINLTWQYSKSGFIPVSATPYNAEFVNEAIREEFTEKNQGEPIVFMRYSGKNEPTFESYEQIQDYVHSVVKVFDSWDEAQKTRDDTNAKKVSASVRKFKKTSLKAKAEEVEKQARTRKKTSERVAKKTRTEMDAINDTSALKALEAQERSVSVNEQAAQAAREIKAEVEKKEPKKRTKKKAEEPAPKKRTRKKVEPETAKEMAERDAFGMTETPETAQQVATGRKKTAKIEEPKKKNTQPKQEKPKSEAKKQEKAQPKQKNKAKSKEPKQETAQPKQEKTNKKVLEKAWAPLEKAKGALEKASDALSKIKFNPDSTIAKTANFISEVIDGMKAGDDRFDSFGRVYSYILEIEYWNGVVNNDPNDLLISFGYSNFNQAIKKLEDNISSALYAPPQEAVDAIIDAVKAINEAGEALYGEDWLEKPAFLRPSYYSLPDEKDLSTYFQLSEDRIRGAVTFTGDEITRAYKILLSPDATLDTIVHETSHIILDAMYRTAQRKDTTPEFKQQYALLEAWLGLKPGQTPTREQQERFADQAVLYISEGETEIGEEGNAAFEFTKEALRAYKARADARGDKLSPEADAFFAKFFSADDAFREIARQAVSEELGATLAITPPDMMDQLLERAEAAADGVLRKDEIARLRAELSRLTDEEKKTAAEIFKRHLSEIKNSPGFLVRRAILDGEYEGISLDGIRLNRAELKTELGIENLTPEASGLTAKDGLTWEEMKAVLPLAGKFASAKEFYEAVVNAPNSATAEARRRGKAEFAETVGAEFASRHIALEEAVQKNSVTLTVINEAFTTLKKLGRSTANLANMEAAVGETIADAVHSRLNYKSWLAQARYAQRKVMTALTPYKSGKGGVDVPKAAYWQERHLFAMLMQEGIRAEEYSYRRDNKWMRNAGKKEALAELDRGGAEFRDVMAEFLEAVGAKRMEEGAQVKDRKTLSDLKDYINAHAEEIGEGWTWDDARLNGILAAKTPLRDMRVADRRYLSDFLHYLANFGQSKQVDIGGVSLSVSDWAKRAAESLNGTPIKPVPLTNTGNSPADVVLNWSAKSQESKLIFDWLGDAGKQMWNAMKDAEYNKTLLGRDIGEDLSRIFNPDRPAMKRLMESVDLGEAFTFPAAIKGGFTRQNLIAMLLNMGNEGNQQRLLAGFGGEENGWTADAVMNYLNANLTEDEIKLASEIWQLFDQKLYPRVAETFRRTENRPLGKVPAVTLDTKSGIITGGYYPIRYDSRISQSGTKQELSAAKEVKDWREACQDGFTKKRARVNNEPLSLDLTFLPSAVLQQIHYATHEYETANISRLLNDKSYQAALKAHLGKYRASLPEQVLKVFANGPERATLGTVYDKLASAMTNAVLAFTMPMVLGDWARPVMATGMGQINAADGIRALLNIKSSMQRAAEMSKAYNILSGNFRQRFVSSAYAEFNSAPINATAKRRIQRLQELGFAHAEFNTKIIMAIMWNARFEEETRRLTAEGLDEATIRTRARDAADDVVFKMTPNTVDWMKSPIQNNPLYRVAAVFASEGLKMYSILQHTSPLNIIDNAKQGEWQKAIRGAVSVASVLITYPLLSALLMGRGPDKDEDSWDWAARTILQQMAGFEPIIAANAYALAEAKIRGKPANGAQMPAIAMLERMEKGLFTAADSNKETAERFLGAVDAFGPLAGVPTNQTDKTVKALLGIGNTDKIQKPEDFIEAWMYGRSQKRGWNIISRGEK